MVKALKKDIEFIRGDSFYKSYQVKIAGVSINLHQYQQILFQVSEAENRTGGTLINLRLGDGVIIDPENPARMILSAPASAMKQLKKNTYNYSLRLVYASGAAFTWMYGRFIGVEVGGMLDQEYGPVIVPEPIVFGDPNEIGRYVESEGGWIAGFIQSPAGHARWALIVPGIEAESEPVQYAVQPAFWTYAYSLIDGLANTNHILQRVDGEEQWDRDVESFPVIHFAKQLRDQLLHQKSDWYVPSPYEMNLIYRAFKPGYTENNLNRGENFYSEPILGNYLPDNPAVTTVETFRPGEVNAFSETLYRTSKESGMNSVIHLSMGSGDDQVASGKQTYYPVRCVRRRYL